MMIRNLIFTVTTALTAASMTILPVSAQMAGITQRETENFKYTKAEVKQLPENAGKLEITEPGTYTLTGKMDGTVYVNPGKGDVKLILDGADIRSDSAGIVAVSGDSLTIQMKEGSISRITDSKTNTIFNSAIYSTVDTFFEGTGALYVNGHSQYGIRTENAELTFNGGAFAVTAPDTAFISDGTTPEEINFNDGHFSVLSDELFQADAGMNRTGGQFQNEEQQIWTPEQQSDSGSETDFSGSAQYEFQNSTAIVSTTDTAGEIVTGTVTNSAAELEADYENATYITVTDEENQVTISSSGTYVVSGTCSDGNITVKKGTTGVVLVLENLDLTSTTGATVSVNKEAEVQIIISGEVTLTDNEDPDDEDSEDEETADAFDGAAIKTKANSTVYITGDGTLTINGNAKNGIKAGDDSSLIFDGVTVNITAVNDGINGNYDITLLSGTFNIDAGDDAIHADHILTIGSEDGTGPTVNITNSTEGLEGTVVNINGGDINITSSDDAINAANSDAAYEDELEYSVNITGGDIEINAGGDGIDSNGNVNLIDGAATITSSSAAGEAGIDYDGELYISEDFELNNNGGVAGPDGMMMDNNIGTPDNQASTVPGISSQNFGGNSGPAFSGNGMGPESH